MQFVSGKLRADCRGTGRAAGGLEGLQRGWKSCRGAGRAAEGLEGLQGDTFQDNVTHIISCTRYTRIQA